MSIRPRCIATSIMLFMFATIGIASWPGQAYSAVWQWSVPDGNARAYLWVPDSCQRIRAVVVANHNMIEQGILEHPMMRKALTDLGIAEVWVVPAMDGIFNFNKGAGEHFDQIIKSLADESGYSELANAPVVPLGHSACATYPWNFAAWNPQRTLAVLSVHGDAPQTNRTGYGRPNIDWGDHNIDGVPGLMVMGEYEWSEDRLAPAFDFMAKHPVSPIAFLADAGHGHYDYSDHLVKILALFICKAAEQRLPADNGTDGPVLLKPIDPKNGWRYDRWHKDKPPAAPAAPYLHYTGDPTQAFWCFDQETADAIESHEARARGKKPQLLGFSYDGKTIAGEPANLPFAPLDDGISFHLSGTFLDIVSGNGTNPARWAGLPNGTPLGHASKGGPVVISRIVGPVAQTGPDTFSIRLDRSVYTANGRNNDLWMLASHPGDDQYKSAVQQGTIRIVPNKAGTPQTITFPKISDQSIDVTNLKLAATSDAKLPVSYYIREGPAEVDGDQLIFSPIPPRARFPVKVTVVAWQWGKASEPKVQTAQVVEQTFYILKSEDKADPEKAGNSPKASLDLGGPEFSNWTGLDNSKQGSASLSLPGEGTYRVPDGPLGWHPSGLREDNDSTIDLRQWYGLKFDIYLDHDSQFNGMWTLRIPIRKGRDDLPHSCAASITLQGTGWHTVTVPCSAFDYNRGQQMMLKYVKELCFSGSFKAQPTSTIQLRNVRLIRGRVLHLESDICSRPAEAGGSVSYTALITNCTDSPQLVTLGLERTGWEGMTSNVTPDRLALKPGQSMPVTIQVTVPGTIPAGAQETQTLVATAQDSDSEPEKLQFITLRRLQSPYLVLTRDGWDAVRAEVANNDWAKQSQAKFAASADAFNIPVVPPGGIESDQGTRAVFKSYIEHDIWPIAMAWKLTGDKKYAEKLAVFLLRLSDPVNGYPLTLHASSQGIPQEGGLFEVAAQSYDLIRESGVLSDQDQQQIESTFRLYIKLQEDGSGYGGISNWSLFNLCPAAQCALAIQDLSEFNTLMNMPCGIVDHIRYGIMDDGWWYEMSLSYNLGCASVLTGLGIAARPFGIDLLNKKFPVATTQNVGLRPFEYQHFQGMAFGKFGSVNDNTVSIKKMWDGIAIYPDYRGVMFGMGDGHEDRVSGGPFEKAYFAYRDPAYAAIIKQGHGRDLLYGIADLPAETPLLYASSGHSDDAGIAVLRSQTPDRPASEQIQAVLKFGTHGGYHGHFDRLSLDSLMRYGRSFYNPETSWFGYGSYMYKWWVQTSLSHNMVVVDAKMQEPAECQLELFHSGKMMQVISAKTTTRWSNPPYFGGYDQLDRVLSGDAPYVPIPATHPAPAEVTDYTEPVVQRRLMIVTDDYVVLADYLDGGHSHTFDNLLHLRGASLMDADKAKFLGHDAQFDTNPLGSGQFISNVNRYAVTAPAIIHSIHRYGERTQGNTWNSGGSRNWETGGASSLSEPGILQIDEHILWPAQAEVRIGNYAESWNVSKKVTYDVDGDGASLKSGTFGAWILGNAVVDVDVRGLKKLTLNTQCHRSGNTLKTLFWCNPTITTVDGKELPLKQLSTIMNNVSMPEVAGKDYRGGEVSVCGEDYQHVIPAEPMDVSKAAIITIDLSSLNAAHFKAVLGGDWPVGDQEQLRKVCSVRTIGNTARFLTLIEPYEEHPKVKTAIAADGDSIHVELTDGSTQDISISEGDSPVVVLRESKNGKLIDTESTHDDR